MMNEQFIIGRTISSAKIVEMGRPDVKVDAVQIDFTDGSFILLSPRKVNDLFDVKIGLMDQGKVTHLNG